MNKKLYDFYITDRSYRNEYRRSLGRDLAAEFSTAGLSDEERITRRFEILCDAEVPHIHDFEQIVMVRTNSQIPDCFTEAEWEQRRKEHYIHESGYVSNLSPNYAKVIEKGLLYFRESADEYGKRVIDACISVCDRYLEEAKRQNRADLAQIFSNVPRYGARSFREALQFFRILHFFLSQHGRPLRSVYVPLL